MEPPVVYQTTHHTHHNLDGLLVALALLAHERAPGLKVEGMSQGRQQQTEAFILYSPAGGQDAPHPLPVPKVGLGHLAREGMHLHVADNVGHHRLGPAVVGVDLRERYPQTLLRIGNLGPRRRVGWRVGRPPMPRARGERGALVGEVAVDGEPLYPRLLSYSANGRPGHPYRLVQLDDPPPRLLLAPGTPLHVVLACRAMCFPNLVNKLVLSKLEEHRRGSNESSRS